MKNKKGFTLIELLTVIAILGILVLLATPKLIDYTKQAKLAQIKNDIKSHEVQISTELIENKDFTENWNPVSKESMEENRAKMYNVRGKIKNDYIFEGEYLEIPEKEDKKIKTHLDGQFIFDSKKETAYYIGEGGITTPVTPDPPVDMDKKEKWIMTRLPTLKIGLGTLYFQNSEGPAYFLNNDKFTVKNTVDHLNLYHPNSPEYINETFPVYKSFEFDSNLLVKNPNVKAYMSGDKSISYYDNRLFEASMNKDIDIDVKKGSDKEVYTLKPNAISSGILKEVPLAEALDLEIVRNDGGIILHNVVTGDFSFYYVNEDKNQGYGGNGIQIGQPVVTFIHNRYVPEANVMTREYTGSRNEVIARGAVEQPDGTFLLVTKNPSLHYLTDSISSIEYKLVE